MTQVEILEPARNTTGGYKADVGRGERIGCKNGSPVRRDADEVFRRLNVSADVHEVGQQLRSVAQRVG